MEMDLENYILLKTIQLCVPKNEICLIAFRRLYCRLQQNCIPFLNLRPSFSHFLIIYFIVVWYSLL